MRGSKKLPLCKSSNGVNFTNFLNKSNNRKFQVSKRDSSSKPSKPKRSKILKVFENQPNQSDRDDPLEKYFVKKRPAIAPPAPTIEPKAKDSVDLLKNFAKGIPFLPFIDEKKADQSIDLDKSSNRKPLERIANKIQSPMDMVIEKLQMHFNNKPLELRFSQVRDELVDVFNAKFADELEKSTKNAEIQTSMYYPSPSTGLADKNQTDLARQTEHGALNPIQKDSFELQEKSGKIDGFLLERLRIENVKPSADIQMGGKFFKIEDLY